MAVNCTSAGLPHHSQRLPRGAESTATGWRNSFFDIRCPPGSCSWLIKNTITNTFKGKPVSGGQRLWRVHGDTANPGNAQHRPGATSLPLLDHVEKCIATCLSAGYQSMQLHYSTFLSNAPVNFLAESVMYVPPSCSEEDKRQRRRWVGGLVLVLLTGRFVGFYRVPLHLIKS